MVVSATLDQAINKSAVKPLCRTGLLAAQALTRFEPEVALAIALGSEPPYHDDPPEGPDSYLADHDFEYIDGERTRHIKRRRRSPEYRHNTADGEGDGDPVPGLPCVIDRSAPPCGLLWSVAGGTVAAAHPRAKWRPSTLTPYLPRPMRMGFSTPPPPDAPALTHRQLLSFSSPRGIWIS
ncbi:hypothetical protein EDB83DRAFT_771708 [Lactarius deliciosus]|nr:hypothetical protein EDB83DRAFT_771708 [Lactarius deliciosus]